MNVKYLVTFSNPRFQGRPMFDTKQQAIDYGNEVRNRRGWTYKIYPVAQ
jgi:hypothetical protein